MKTNKLRVLGLVALLFLAGCATGPRLADIESTLPQLETEKGRIWFYRTGTFGAAIQPSIQLNEEVVGKSVPGGVFFHDVDPGDYVVATSTEVERRLTFTIAKGQERFVKTSAGFGLLVTRIHPELIEPEEARLDIAGLSFTGK